MPNQQAMLNCWRLRRHGPFNASFTGDIELKNIDAPNSYKIIGSGNSPVGFASGEADVKLEDINNGETNLIYTVEANVGGKIAQVGSRLIDMTAKKMADIFFGKFSDLIAPSSETLVSDAPEEKISTSEKVKSNKISKKIIIYSLAALIIIVILYNYF